MKINKEALAILKACSGTRKSFRNGMYIIDGEGFTKPELLKKHPGIVLRMEADQSISTGKKIGFNWAGNETIEAGVFPISETDFSRLTFFHNAFSLTTEKGTMVWSDGTKTPIAKGADFTSFISAYSKQAVAIYDV